MFADMLERSAWTFVQAFVGVLVGVNVTTGTVNWKEVLITAAVAGIVSVLKAFGVKGSQVAAVKASVTEVRLALPAVDTAVKSAEKSPVVATSEEVAARVAAEMTK